MAKKNWAPALSMISQIGFLMITPILVCMIFGGWLDRKIGPSPLWLVIFIILGVGAAFRNLFYMTAKAQKKGKKKDE